MLKYTLQTILLSESVLWFHKLRNCLNNQKDGFESLKKEALFNVQQFGLVFILLIL